MNLSPRARRGLVRPYVVTGGRAHPTRNTIDLISLVTSVRDLPPSGLTPEKRRLAELCLPGALSVAEIAGHLELPVSVTKVLVADLVDSGHIRIRPPIPKAQRADAELLEKIIDGLQRL